MTIDDADVRAALTRIAGTKDGYLLFKHFQRTALLPAPSTESGALQAHEGVRRFALAMMALMIEATKLEPARDGRLEPDDTNRIDRKSVVVAGRRGHGRRVEPYPTDDGTKPT